MLNGKAVTSTGGREFAYHSRDELAQLSDEALAALSESIPGEAADMLRRRYRSILKEKGITGDAQELAIIGQYQDRYTYEGLVPVVKGWVKVSPSKRHAFIHETDEAGDDEDIRLPSSTGRRWLLMGLFMVGAFGLIFLMGRLASRGNRASAAALTPIVTASPTHTPTPVFTPTPTATPLALLESDRFINSGDEAHQRFYPVFLQVALPGTESPRVFVVQQRLVDTAEWSFETNPDVVSWISGMLIRPVIGVPFSETNQELFDSLVPDTRFKLRMNTGQELDFVYRESHQVGREDTRLFQQTEPGLVFVLIGETDEFSMPTASRQVIIADYVAQQEMQTLGVASSTAATVGQVVPVGDFALQVTGVSMQPATEDVTAPFVYGLVDVNIRLASDAEDGDHSLAAYQWFLEDSEGARYSPDPNADGVSHFGRLPGTVEAGQTVSASLGFVIPRYTAEARLLVAAPGGSLQSFALPFEGLPLPASVESLDIQVRSIRRDTRSVSVEARFYNPQSSEVRVSPEDVWMIFGFTPNPTGARSAPQQWQGLNLVPGAAYDVLIPFDWNGRDPYALLGIGGREYGIVLMEN